MDDSDNRDKRREAHTKVFGMVANMSHDEVAEILGISRARVGQIEIAALKKLRTRIINLGYRVEDFFR